MKKGGGVEGKGEDVLWHDPVCTLLPDSWSEYSFRR